MSSQMIYNNPARFVVNFIIFKHLIKISRYSSQLYDFIGALMPSILFYP